LVRPGAVLFPTHVFVITSAFMALIGAFVLTQLNLLAPDSISSWRCCSPPGDRARA
jgi:hypothetical protein